MFMLLELHLQRLSQGLFRCHQRGLRLRIHVHCISSFSTKCEAISPAFLSFLPQILTSSVYAKNHATKNINVKSR